MKIIQLECWAHHMRLGEPYTIAYETIDTAPNVFLKATTDNGLTGWGCAAPDLEVTGETAEMVVRTYNDTIEPFLRGQDPFRYALLLQELRNYIPNAHSALAMVDMLLFDLMAQQAGEPLYKLLGGFRTSIPTSITIGILPVQETAERAKAFMSKGFRILKLKGGSSLEEDVEKVMLVREKVGQETEIRFDANQGYSVKEAIDFIKRTSTARVELLEQPTDRHNDELIKEVSENVSIPIMADESLMTLKDVFHLTSHGCIDMINIKLMKVGGIMEALHINSVAKADNVEAMVGCMDESALGIAAGLHFALSRPNIRYADLDGHFDLVDDPFAGMVRLEEGVLYPMEGPGLGVKG
ncbi:MAG: dipeptide epimerase [Lewinellaceae bacterium]|nr:dipeptide epimerase [Phaeodactylibacter sp.]MCB9347039.1 dipeptide epimerase [Lewinellaceae bacterium]